MELWFEALVDVSTGFLYCLFSFGLLYFLTWYYGSFAWRIWWIAPVITSTFFLVACWSAWRQVNPLEGLRQLTDTEMLLTELSLATPNLLFFSPRHAVSGSAVLIIGGPANLLNAIGSILHRLPSSSSTRRDAATLLSLAAQGCVVNTITDPQPVVLLYRLALIKTDTTSRPQQPSIILTQTGRDVLTGHTSI